VSRPESEYLEQLGWALYNFQSLEWIVVWQICGVDADTARIAETARKTAGQIAAEFKAEAAGSADLVSLADRFEELAKRRNDLAHSRPATNESGADLRLQQLYRWDLARQISPKWIDEAWLNKFTTDVQVLKRDMAALRA